MIRFNTHSTFTYITRISVASLERIQITFFVLQSGLCFRHCLSHHLCYSASFSLCSSLFHLSLHPSLSPLLCHESAIFTHTYKKPQRHTRERHTHKQSHRTYALTNMRRPWHMYTSCTHTHILLLHAYTQDKSGAIEMCELVRLAEVLNYLL